MTNFVTYFVPCEDDAAATACANELVNRVLGLGGYVGFAYSHSHGPAYVILELPEGVFPDDLGVTNALRPVTTQEEANPGSTDLDGLTVDEGRDIDGD